MKIETKKEASGIIMGLSQVFMIMAMVPILESEYKYEGYFFYVLFLLIYMCGFFIIKTVDGDNISKNQFIMIGLSVLAIGVQIGIMCLSYIVRHPKISDTNFFNITFVSVLIVVSILIAAIGMAIVIDRGRLR